MPITIHEGSDFEPIKAGAYPATLREVEGPSEGEYGRRYKFIFDGDDKKMYLGFASLPTDKDGNEIAVTTKHKIGRWLCGLAGEKPKHMDIEPKDYYGKKYLLIFAENSQGNVSLNTFSPMS